MRELKFRIWDKEANNWLEAVDIVLHCSGRIINLPPNLEIQQWTGLTDKNGRDIYEGDIVVTENEQVTVYPVEEEYKGVVTYQNTGFHIVQPHRHYIPTLNNLAIVSIEVIGNIYQTPELLS